MLQKRNERIICMIADLLILVFGLIGTWLHYEKYGIGMFQYYTLDSNLFATAAFGIAAFFEVRGWKSGNGIPVWVDNLKYYSTCTVMVTFVIVVFVLSPMVAIDLDAAYIKAVGVLLTEKEMLYHHLLVPVLCFASVCFVDKELQETSFIAVKALTFTFIYGVTALVLNGMNILDGPYPFLKVHEQPVLITFVWVAVILGLSYGLARAAYELNQRGKKN